jgi:hypothetical protein
MPHKRNRPAGNRAAQQIVGAPSAVHTTDVACQLRVRRAASWRLSAPEHINRADPWHYNDGPPVASYEPAAQHLLAHGLVPSPNTFALRDMWRAGGRSRYHARVIVQAWDFAT